MENRQNLITPTSYNILNRNSSLKPFPVLNNEFFCEEKKNILWENEVNKTKLENSISRQNSERKFLNNNIFIFNKVKIFYKNIIILV